MKTLLLLMLMATAGVCSGQAIVGKWQLTEDKSCIESQIGQSETEKELSSAMGSSRNAVARLIIFRKDGTGEEGVFSAGRKKGSDMMPFKWKIDGTQLNLMDKKSGIITQRFLLDELGSSTLRIHNAMRECEVKVFTRIN